MRRLRAWFVRLVDGSLRRRRRERDFSDEMASHLEMHVDDNIRAGMTPDAARRAALVRLGGVESIKDAHRDRRGLPVVDAVLRDVRYALRSWRRNPGFAVVAVLSLALGIGANTAIFSILDALVLRALPIAAPDRLVQVEREANRTVLSNPIWESIRDHHVFERAGAWSATRFNLSQGGEVDTAQGLWVSGGFFDMLGVQPAQGRLIAPQDDRRIAGADPDLALLRAGAAMPDPIAPAAASRPPDATAVAVLSDAFWHRRFGASPDIVGRSVTLDGVPFTIVGVTAPGFFGPEVGRTFDVAVPLASEPLTRPRSMLDERAGWWLSVFARLGPGQSIAGATRSLIAAQTQIRAETMPDELRASDLQRYLRAPMDVAPASTGVSDLRRAYATPLSIVMAVVGVVLLIACVNLANLLLARADARRHEMSVRLAIGASRARLIRQMLVESLLLACCGGALGLLVAEAGGRLLVAQLSSGANVVALPVSIDWRVLAFTSMAAIAAAFIFGIAPAVRATDTAPHQALAAQGRSLSGRQSPVVSVLVSVQVALSLVLVIAGGLFVRTFTSLANAPLGIDAGALLVVNLDARRSATPPIARLPLMMRARDAVRALPGVGDAALSAMTPFAGQWDTLVDNPDGMSLTEDERDVFLNSVSPDWFSTYGVSLREGRHLTAEDGRVQPLQSAVINRTAAKRFFPGRTPIGQVLNENRGPGRTHAWTVVGVVDDAVYDSVRSGVPPTMYEPLSPAQPVAALTMTVRAAGGSPESIARSVIAAIGGIDPMISVTVQPLDARVGAALLRERLLAYLSGFFGALALLLAGLGLYGVVSYDTSRRQREIGIRLALGARPSTLTALLGRRVAWLVAAGIAAGALVSAWCARFVAALLYGLDARDAATFVGASLLLMAVAAIAALIPARRATRLDPTTVLREG